MTAPAMIYGTTEEWRFCMEAPDWVKRCRTCRSYIIDEQGHPGRGHEGPHNKPTTVCNVSVACVNPERCNPHNREGEVPLLFKLRETFEQGELRRAREVRAAA